jgi:predicted CxxxxCH...CXXCH cytochrome family protein
MPRFSVLGSASLPLSVVLAAMVVASCGELPVGESGVRVAPASQPESSLRVPGSSNRLTQDHVYPPGPTCSPSGAHDTKHAQSCIVCHACGGVLQFQAGGPAVAPGYPAPSFDATTKTCSNIGCHSVPAGTFSYYFPDGTGEAALNTVTYGGGAPHNTPSWYATGLGCTACHDNPPRNGSSGSNVWHSGYHGGQGPTGARNQCQFCHPDATGINGAGTAITNAALHGNGVVNVQASFSSTCFGCH